MCFKPPRFWEAFEVSPSPAGVWGEAGRAGAALGQVGNGSLLCCRRSEEFRSVSFQDQWLRVCRSEAFGGGNGG